MEREEALKDMRAAFEAGKAKAVSGSEAYKAHQGSVRLDRQPVRRVHGDRRRSGQ